MLAATGTTGSPHWCTPTNCHPSAAASVSRSLPPSPPPSLLRCRWNYGVTAPRRSPQHAAVANPQLTSSADCVDVDVASQAIAVSLSLEDYRAALLASSPTATPQQWAGLAAAAAQPPPAAVPPPLQWASPTGSHASLTSADLDSMPLCSSCSFPCYLSGAPTCEAGRFLEAWAQDAPLKPRAFDSHATATLHGVADIAAVSRGGRANGRWKPDNQDAFLLQMPPPQQQRQPAASGAAAIGVFDGHGRLGAAAASVVRQAMAERLADADADSFSLQAPSSEAGSASAQLLGECFAAAGIALERSGRDFSKSGCTAVLALLERGCLSVAWAGDSRAVLGVYDPPPALLSAAYASAPGGGGGGEASCWDMQPSSLPSVCCAAVPLTDDHKPDRPGERERIEAAGGRVTRIATDACGQPAGPARVFLPAHWTPGLALSRAFGDTLAGSVGVISTPEILEVPLPHPAAARRRTPPPPEAVSNAASASCCSSASPSVLSSCDGEEGSDGASGSSARGSGAGVRRGVLIVASDGLWEWVGNSTAVAIASAMNTAEEAAEALVEAAQKQWAVRYRGRHCDDITCVVAFLR